MTKIILIIFILFLIIATTLTKNSTKKIDAKIFNLKEEIKLLNDKYELELLDHNYLSSPKKLVEYQKNFFENELVPFDIKNIKEITFAGEEIFIKEVLKDK